MDKVNFVAYNVLQYRYNQAFRRKYRIKTNHLNILNTLYYFHLSPPKGRVKRAIRECNSLHSHEFIDLMLLYLYDNGMIEYKKEANGYYIIHLLPHVIKDMKELYDMSTIEQYIKSKI